MEFRSPTVQSVGKMLAISYVMGGAVCLLLWIYLSQGGSRVYAGFLFLLTAASLAAFFYIGPFWTRLVLEPRSLWIGYRSRGRDIPYEAVRFINGWDYDGDPFAPEDPADALAGARRVVRFWRGQAAVWLGLAAAIASAAGIVVAIKGGHSLTAGPLGGLAVLVAQTVAFGSYSIVRFRRASRIAAIIRPRTG